MKPPRFLLVLPVLVGLSACAVGNSALPHEHLAIAKLSGGGTARITVRWPKAWALKAMPEATSSLQINVWDAAHANKLDTVTLVRGSEAQVSTSLPRSGGATLPAGELQFEAIAFDYNGNQLASTSATATLTETERSAAVARHAATSRLASENVREGFRRITRFPGRRCAPRGTDSVHGARVHRGRPARGIDPRAAPLTHPRGCSSCIGTSGGDSYVAVTRQTRSPGRVRPRVSLDLRTISSG